MIQCLFCSYSFCSVVHLYSSNSNSTKWHFIMDWTFLKLVGERMYPMYHISWRWSTNLFEYISMGALWTMLNRILLIHAISSRTFKGSPRRGYSCTAQIMILLGQYCPFYWHHHGFDWPKCPNVTLTSGPIWSPIWHPTADMKHF